MQFFGFALAALIGLSLGIMGGGGSILTVPVFVYVLGFDPKLAIAMSLPVVGGTSLIGALSHWKAGNVNLKTAFLFGAIACARSHRDRRRPDHGRHESRRVSPVGRLANGRGDDGTPSQ